jgi:hypothetical protein
MDARQLIKPNQMTSHQLYISIFNGEQWFERMETQRILIMRQVLKSSSSYVSYLNGISLVFIPIARERERQIRSVVQLCAEYFNNDDELSNHQRTNTMIIAESYSWPVNVLFLVVFARYLISRCTFSSLH